MSNQPEELIRAALKDGCRAHCDSLIDELRRLHTELAEYERWSDRDEARAENAERERDIAEAHCKELGAALRRLICYCNNLENRLMDADGEHPALQEAKEALQREKALSLIHI